MPIIFDKNEGRFRFSGGRSIADKEIYAVIEKIERKTAEDLTALAKRLTGGEITLAEWQKRTSRKLQAAHYLTFVSAKGDGEKINPDEKKQILAEIRSQTEYLNSFAKKIELKQITAQQIEKRAALYARAVRTNFFKAEKELRQASGMRFARRVLHASETCVACAEWAKKGFVSIDEQPDIGSLICGSFCRCTLEYRDEQAKGFFTFMQEDSLPYTPEGELYGQNEESSCVPTSTKMILSDFGIFIPEAFIRAELGTDNFGTPLSSTVKFLNFAVEEDRFIYESKITFSELKKAVGKNSAMVNVRSDKLVHALVVDEIKGGKVYIRDPLPTGSGTAYAIDEKDFLKYWEFSGESYGVAVIVK